MSEHPRPYVPRRPRPSASRGPVIAAYADKIEFPCQNCGAEANGWRKTPHGTDAIAPCWNRGAKVGAR